MIRPIPIALCAIAATALLPSCCITNHRLGDNPLPPIPSYRPDAEGTPIRRVAVLPLYCEQDSGDSLRPLDTAFHAELSKTNFFELVPISRLQLESLTAHRQFSSVETVPGDLLQQLVARYGVDAVIFTDVTHYFPYQPISIGTRSKLVDVRTGQIRWATDYLFDSGKPEVAEAARSFYLQNSQTNLPIKDEGAGVLQSPIRFAQFVAHETYRTLSKEPPSSVCKIVLNFPRKAPIIQ